MSVTRQVSKKTQVKALQMKNELDGAGINSRSDMARRKGWRI